MPIFAPMKERKHIPKLPNAPLKEVVFEARWDPMSTEKGEELDGGFELAQGRFAERLEPDFEPPLRVVQQQFPSTLLTGHIVHQFWSPGRSFPLVQFGPCILTVNQDGPGYEWEEGYKQLIRKTLKRLYDSYKGELRLSEVRLFYVDAIDLPDAENIPGHLEKLKVSLSFNERNTDDLFRVGAEFGYRLEQDSTLHISVRNGTNNKTGAPALIWHTSVHRAECRTWHDHEQVVDAVMEWCDYAHSITSNLFKNMTEGELYDSFL